MTNYKRPNQTTKNTETAANETTKRPYILNDYEMNEKVADYIINIIESGNVKEWHKAWTFCKDVNELYYAVIDGNAASLVYCPQVLSDALNPDIPAGFYVTFKDIKANKLRLNKGSKGTPIYVPHTFYKNLTKNEMEALCSTIEKDEKLKLHWDAFMDRKEFQFHACFTFINTKGQMTMFDEILELKNNAVMYKRFQYVLTYLFNNNDLADPVDVKKLWKVTERKEKAHNEIIAEAESVKDSYIERSGIKFSTVQQDRAFYNTGSHSVVIPDLQQFDNNTEYYGTMFHEFAHSTGYYKLLNRKTLMENNGMHSTSYAKEELVAELSSIYTLTALSLINDDVLSNSIAYLKSWGKELRSKIRHNIINTIQHAHKATNLILNIDQKAAKASAAKPVEAEAVKEPVKETKENIKKENKGTRVAGSASYIMTIKGAKKVQTKKIADVETNGIKTSVFVYHPEGKKTWILTEEKTGMCLTGNGFRTIADAKESYLNSYREKLEKYLNNCLPAYKKSINRLDSAIASLA